MKSSVKHLIVTMAATVIACGGLTACGSGDNGEPDVYFLNFKPEQDAAYQKIAKAYTEKTGVPVKVVTAASGTYEQTLKAEIGKSDAPTLFQVNGPVGFHTWNKYMADLSATAIGTSLKPSVQPLKGDDGKTYGVPFAVEGYGIIYNQGILDKYFALPSAAVKSIDEVNDFASLKKMADDIQAKKSELGIDGAFASTSLASGEDWRWGTHLANIPVYYEFKDLGVEDSPELKFSYNKEYKNLFDLYLTDSTVERTLAPSKAVSDSMAEFAQGKAAMVQNGNWAWSQIQGVDGNVVTADQIKFLPMYTGMKDDPTQGLSVGTENYLAVNSKASEEDQKATIDFINWLYTTDEGKEHVINDLGFVAPFTQFEEKDTPNDPLVKEITRYLDNDKLNNIPWVFQHFPSQQFKEDFGQALAQYAAGKMSWDDVVSTFVDSWKQEKAATK